MSLRKKTLIIFGVALASLLAIFYFVSSSILLNGFSDLETSGAGDDVQRALNTLDDERGLFANTTVDWASWDDTYAFIDDHNQNYMESNLLIDSSWTSNRVNLMAFINIAGQLVYAKAFDLEASHEVPVSPGAASQIISDQRLRAKPESKDGISGIVLLPEGPMIIAAQPILRSDDQGPARGTLIWGRYLDQSELERFSRMNRRDMAVFTMNDPALDSGVRNSLIASSATPPLSTVKVNSSTIGAFTLLRDIYEQPALALRLEIPRTIFQTGQGTMYYLFVSLLAAGIIFSGLTLLLLERLVLSRVSRLSGDVRTIADRGDHTARVSASGKDEISNLGNGINKMLGALELSRGELQETNRLLEESLKERMEKIEMLKALTEIDKELSSRTDCAEVLPLVCLRSAEALKVPKSLIVLERFGSLEIAAAHGIKEPVTSLVGFLPYINERYRGASVSQVSAFNDLSRADIPGLPESDGFASMAIAPLVTVSGMVGAMFLFDSSVHEWTADETQMLGLLADELAQAVGRKRLFDEERLRRRELSALYELSSEMANADLDVNGILGAVVIRSVQDLQVTYARVDLLINNELVIRAVEPRRARDMLAIGTRTALVDMPVAARAIKDCKPVVVTDTDASLAGLERNVLFDGIARSVCVIPLCTAERAWGVLVLGEERSPQRDPFTEEKVELAMSMGEQTTSALRRADLFEQLEQSYFQTVLALANAIDAKDTYTKNHAEQLAALAAIVGKAMGLSPPEMEDLRYGAILHDIGKIGIPDELLQKRELLNEDEWRQVKEHPAIGQRILEPISRMRGAARIVRAHHERFDGTGYPDGLAGQEIPLAARILSVADAYGAMTDRRIYSEAISRDLALAELEQNRGAQFDPQVVDVFLKLAHEGALT